MSIITISRGSYSYGKEIAEKLAAALDYECISREILIEASEQFHVPEIKLVHAIHDSPSILDRFTHGKERYIAYIRAVLLQHFKKDNIVYHGLAGHFFLKDISHVLKVRILADMDKRIEVVMKRDNVGRDKARQIIEKDDMERRKWSQYLYGIDTWDSMLYDVVLRINKLTVDTAVDIILDAIKHPIFAATTESRQKLNDMTAAAQIEAALVDEYPTIQAWVDNGTARVTVKVFIEDSKEATAKIEDIAKGIDGVKTVQVNIRPKTKDIKYI